MLLVAEVVGQVLEQRAPARDVDHLRAAADAEHRDTARLRLPHQGQLGGVAQRDRRIVPRGAPLRPTCPRRGRPRPPAAGRRCGRARARGRRPGRRPAGSAGRCRPPAAPARCSSSARAPPAGPTPTSARAPWRCRGRSRGCTTPSPPEKGTQRPTRPGNSARRSVLGSPNDQWTDAHRDRLPALRGARPQMAALRERPSGLAGDARGVLRRLARTPGVRHADHAAGATPVSARHAAHSPVIAT